MTQAFPTREEILLEGKLEKPRFIKDVFRTVSLLPHLKQFRVLGKCDPNKLMSEEKQLLDTFHPDSSKSCKQYSM